MFGLPIKAQVWRWGSVTARQIPKLSNKGENQFHVFTEQFEPNFDTTLFSETARIDHSEWL